MAKHSAVKGKHVAPGPQGKAAESSRSERRSKRVKARQDRPRKDGGEREPRRLHPALAVLGSVVAVLFVVYGLGVAAFSFVFMPNTTLDGRDVSWKPAGLLSGTYASKISSYQVPVSGDGLSFTVRGSDIDLAFDAGAYERGSLGQQNALTWPLHVLEAKRLTATSGATFSEDKLRALVAPLVEEFDTQATQPQDATIAFDEGSQCYAAVPEVLGDAVDVDGLMAYLEGVLPALPDQISLDDSCLLRPAITVDDEALAAAVDDANRFMTADIPLTLGGQAAGEVTRAQISQWVTLDADHKATLDRDKVAAWAKSEIGAKYDTVGAERTYTRPDGKVVVAADSGNGNYGWITNEAELVDLLVSAIESGSNDAIDIPCRQSASTVPDEHGRDWGNRYIDIDLTEQHVRMYGDDGSLVWESDCVTGDLAKSYDTPRGVFVMNTYRASGDVELRGKIDPKTNEPEYISHVQYWMPFIGNSWALHDANWRSSFGGTIYKANGSHGCVNLPPAKAAELFGLCRVGDVVVVHY